jgi:4-amino-4-deoxy-L-arabinose transferase-like glycosyltransferase
MAASMLGDRRVVGASQPTSGVPSWLVCAFGLATVVTYVCLLGHFGLAEPDEPRYAEIAREMIELRDWVTPHLNYVKYFEKPPLIYWLTAINFELFGTSELVVRVWPAFFGLLGIFVTYTLGRSMFGQWTGCAAAALLATTPFYFGLSQVLILDMPLAALMTVALAAFWFARTDPHRRRAWVLLLYLVTALGVLTKGPVAVVLSAGIILTFLLLRRELSALRWLISPLGLALFVVIALPWFVLVSRRNPEFVDFFVIKQHFDRFVRPDEHRQPLWFFVPIVLGGMLPWSLFALSASPMASRFLRRLSRLRVSAATLYCVVWSAMVFAFFSLSGSKLATYVLPLFCPLALLAARAFHSIIAEHRVDLMRRGCVGLLVFAVAAAVGAAVAAEVLDQPEVGLIVPRVYAGTGMLAVSAGIALALVRRHQRMQVSFVVLLFAMLAIQIAAISARDVAVDYRAFGRIIGAQVRPQDLVISYRHYVQGIPFYARHRVVMVGGRGELDFGSRQGDQRAFFWDTDEQLLAAWGSGRRVFLVINRVELDPLLPRLRPAPRRIAGHDKKVVIVNFE